VVDGELVNERDCGNNFFVTTDSIGQSRAKVVTENLLELNPDVKGDYIHQDIHEFVSKESDLMKSYQLIIATDVDNKVALALSRIAERNDIALIIVRQYGFLGYIRNYKRELDVIEAKPSDVQIDDLRIPNPFPALKEFAL